MERMERLADLIDPALRGLGVRGRVREVQVRDVFAEVVGPALAPMCRAVSLERGVLLVGVANTSLSHQLQLDSARVVSMLNERLGASAVRRLRFTTLEP
jgi:predicted nucleic acid-binding Zn ribbon protein